MPDEKLDNDPGHHVDVKLTKVRLRSAIQKLPESYQQIVVLRYINELNNAEIALTLGKSDGAIRTLQSRALKKLRFILEEDGQDV